MKGVSGDAVENKEANHAISSSDCVIHEVFGSVLGAECMTRLLSNIGDNTVVIPDTAGTFFKLCSFSSQNVLDMINVRSKQTIHIYRKVSYVRGLDFEFCGGISENIGVLELYEGGSIPGRAKTWCKKKSQRYTSEFRILRQGVIHALACWIFLGHGDKDESSKRRRGHRKSFQGEEHGEKDTEKKKMIVKHYQKTDTTDRTVPERFHRLSTNSMDPITSATEGAWKNPLMFLPQPLQVAEGSLVLVATQVKNIGTKSQYYQITIYYRKEPGSQEMEKLMRWNVGLADLYPWYAEE